MSAIAQMRTLNPSRARAIQHSFGARALVFLFWFVFVLREGFAVLGGALGLTPSQATAATGGVAASFLLATVLMALFGCPSTSWRGLFQSVAPMKWIGLFLLWSTFSLTWTQADSKMVALGYLCLSLAMVVTVVAQLKTFEPAELFNHASTGLVAGALTLVMIAIATDTGSGRLGDPDLLHPNTLGRVTAITALIAFHRIRLTGSFAAKVYWLLAGIGLVCALAATVSKTSLGAFMIACLVYFLAGKHSAPAKIASALLVFVFAIGTYYFLSPQLDSYSRQQHGAALETLSGRLPLWQDTWEMIRERPITGYGFLSYRDYGPQLFNVRVVHAHNEWLHIWFSLGLVGVVLAAGVYFAYLRSAWKLLRSSRATGHAALALALLAMALVRGVTEADLVGLVFSLPLLLVAIAPAALSRPERQTVAMQIPRPEWSRAQAVRF
jgi:O-antigen ligase